MLTWLYRDKIRFSRTLAIGLLMALVVCSQFKPALSALFPVAGSYIVLWIGLSPGWHFTRWTEKTDLSYGIYLYAYPVQQILAMFPSLRSPFLNMLIAFPVIVGLAWLSWHFVEQRFLRLKSKTLVDFDPAAATVQVSRAAQLLS